MHIESANESMLDSPEIPPMTFAPVLPLVDKFVIEKVANSCDPRVIKEF